MLAAAGGQFARLLTGIFLARLLGRTTFGQFGLLQNTIGLLGTLASLSLGNTVVKHVAEYRRADRLKAGKMIGFGLLSTGLSASLAAAVLFSFGAQIAKRGLGDAELEGLLKLLCLDIAFNAIDSVQVGALVGMEAFRRTAINANAKSFLNLLITLGGAWIDGLRGAVLGQLITDAMFVVVNGVTLRTRCKDNNIPIRYQVSWSDWHTMRNFSIPTFLTSALGWLAQWFSNAQLGRQTNGYSEFAAFQVGRQWSNIVTMVPSAMGEAGLPMLSNQYGEGRVDDFSQTVRQQYKLSLRMSALAAFGVALLSPLILRAYGKDFTGSYFPILVLSVCGIFQALTTIPNGIVFSMGRVWSGFGFTLAFSAILILSATCLRPYGAVGLSLAYVAAYFADFAMLNTFTARALKTMRRRPRQP